MNQHFLDSVSILKQKSLFAVIGYLGLGVDSYWTGDPGPSQTTVSIRVFIQVLLVVILCVVERLGFGYFSCNRTKTSLGQYLLVLIFGGQGFLELLLCVDVDGRAVLRPEIVPLPHPLGRVVAFPENFEQVGEADLLRMEDNPHHLCMARPSCADFSVGGVRCVSSRVAHLGGINPFLSPKLPLRSPETAHSKYDHLCPVWKRRNSLVTVHIMFGGHFDAVSPARQCGLRCRHLGFRGHLSHTIVDKMTPNQTEPGGGDH